MRKTYVKDLERLRSCRLLARDALLRGGKPEFKRDTSAKWADYQNLGNGQVVAQVQHEDIPGCTPEMIQWFFEHLGCCTTWNGVDFSGPQVSIYHLWHHRDHVAVTPLTDLDGKKNLGFLEGADSMIHELTNEVNDVIHFQMHTIRLDDHEFTFHVMLGGIPMAHVKHIYEATETGSTFYTETKTGVANNLLSRIFVPRIYTKRSGMEWIHHNIQESGRLQDILPVLYANQDKVFYDPDFIKFD